MKDILQITLRLFLITAIAAILLGATYIITEQPIKEAEAKAAEEARASVLSADSFEALDLTTINATEDYANIKEVYLAYDNNHTFLGATLLVSAKGFNPGISLTIGITKDLVISGVNIGNHSETPGLGAKITQESFYTQFSGKSANEAVSVTKSSPSGNEISAISGATKSSNGVTAGVNLAADYFKQYIMPALESEA